MYTSVKKMGQKAFTLVELIIVIVIVGILAAISIVGYQSVVERAEEQAVKTSLESVDREYRALAAFGIADGSLVAEADMTSFTELTFDLGTDNAATTTVDESAFLNAGDTATWVQDGVTGVLTFGTATSAGTIVVSS